MYVVLKKGILLCPGAWRNAGMLKIQHYSMYYDTHVNDQPCIPSRTCIVGAVVGAVVCAVDCPVETIYRYLLYIVHII